MVLALSFLVGSIVVFTMSLLFGIASSEDPYAYCTMNYATHKEECFPGFEGLTSHEAMVKYLDFQSDWNLWSMPQFFTIEEELEIVARMKTQDCRDRIEETGGDSWNKLYLLGMHLTFHSTPFIK